MFDRALLLLVNTFYFKFLLIIMGLKFLWFFHLRFNSVKSQLLSAKFKLRGFSLIYFYSWLFNLSVSIITLVLFLQNCVKIIVNAKALNLSDLLIYRTEIVLIFIIRFTCNVLKMNYFTVYRAFNRWLSSWKLLSIL